MHKNKVSCFLHLRQGLTILCILTKKKLASDKGLMNVMCKKK